MSLSRGDVALGVLLSLAGVSQARAEEVMYQFRTQEDPTKPPDAAVCDAAPFVATVKLGASVYIPLHRPQDGKVVYEGQRRAGTATACLRITDPTFPPGQQVPAHFRFNLPDGTFTATGACTLVSNDVPEPRLVLGGCALKLVEFPEGFKGGMVSSTSIFNPAKLPGYATGSFYTLHAYRDDKAKDARARKQDREEREAAVKTEAKVDK
ncbi:hypothetical protein LZ198_35030 [Myxococcus sp. K15C18031901]|uniref:hypothetical protein n=1 Tax=Myxococcus dinghuensis TaxID=2906761 RepID=UPI0020A83287|nr:hypothetical protein [Myxococcus dinghuensis]MCP3104098.1 hypothetical protein [Myxococcus dinghuensis]